ncbi:hypothetical protein INR49_030148 [Caranx melampygus]|nr:hypothetical protein INR49_030148 [Caranx melampygus]
MSEKQDRGAVKGLAWFLVFGSWSLARREQSGRWRCEDGLSQIPLCCTMADNSWLLQDTGFDLIM